MKTTYKIFIFFFVIASLTSLGLWIAVVTELGKYIHLWKIITLFIAPPLFTALIWAIVKISKSLKKHIERTEKEKDHFQQIRHQVEINQIKKDKIPHYYNFENDPLLKSTNQNQPKENALGTIAGLFKDEQKPKTKRKTNR